MKAAEAECFQRSEETVVCLQHTHTHTHTHTENKTQKLCLQVSVTSTYGDFSPRAAEPVS